MSFHQNIVANNLFALLFFICHSIMTLMNPPLFTSQWIHPIQAVFYPFTTLSLAQFCSQETFSIPTATRPCHVQFFPRHTSPVGQNLGEGLSTHSMACRAARHGAKGRLNATSQRCNRGGQNISWKVVAWCHLSGGGFWLTWEEAQFACLSGLLPRGRGRFLGQ
jgi:hypothetical protein